MDVPFPTRVLRALAWLGGLPGRRLRRTLATLLARLAQGRGGKGVRIIAVNLRLAGLLDRVAPRTVLFHTALTMLESLRFWTRTPARNLAEVVEVIGLERLTAAQARGRGVLLVAPHYGNWELLAQWLAAQGRFSLLYTAAASPALDRFLRLARERHGVRAVPADAHGMKPLLRALQQGGTVGITPDQVPDAGAALWSPFFGVPALPMTLLHRLAQRHPEARLVIAAAVRTAEGRFRVRIEPLPPAVTSGPVQSGVDALNLAVEAFARREPAQYQWTYKRFKGQRPGEPLVNPYWPECY